VAIDGEDKRVKGKGERGRGGGGGEGGRRGERRGRARRGLEAKSCLPCEWLFLDLVEFLKGLFREKSL